MKLLYTAAMAIILCCACGRKTIVTASASQNTTAATAPMLLGKHSKQDLQQTPYKDWFDKNYADYNIDSIAANQLKPAVKDKTFEIFMGTWCGDSKREVPRMLKILAYAGVKPSHIQLIMVGSRDSTYKQSPGHEEAGKEIHRVPTLIMYADKKEINRIVESPVTSIEKDLLSIATHDPSYQSNYKAAAYFYRLLDTKPIDEILNDSANIIQQLKTISKSSNELNTLGYVLMAKYELNKALLAFEFNAMIYPTIANVFDSLGEINLKLNNKEAAKKYYQKVLAMQPDSPNAVKILTQLN